MTKLQELYDDLDPSVQVERLKAKLEAAEAQLVALGNHAMFVSRDANSRHWYNECMKAEAILDAHAGLVAVAKMAFVWTGTNHTEKYENVAEEFYRDTGLMAPGKDDAGFSSMTYEERRAEWDKWMDARIARQREQIGAALAAAGVKP